mgnify:CR=1 FL=1
MMTAESYFVRIPDPDLVKLALLESAKEVLLSSKEYHDLLSIRSDKESAIQELKAQTSEVVALFSKLLSHLPHSEELLAQKQKTPAKKQASKKASTTKKTTTPHHASELDKLNDALYDIEQKLEQLS